MQLVGKIETDGEVHVYSICFELAYTQLLELAYVQAPSPSRMSLPLPIHHRIDRAKYLSRGGGYCR